MKKCFFHIKNLELRQKLFRKSTKLISEIYLRSISIMFCQDFIFKVKNMQVFKHFLGKLTEHNFRHKIFSEHRLSTQNTIENFQHNFPSGAQPFVLATHTWQQWRQNYI